MVAFLLGVAASHEITRPWFWLLPWLIATALLLLRRRHGRIAGLGWFGIGVAFGTAMLVTANAHRPPVRVQGRDIRLVGRVAGLPERGDGRERFLVEPESLSPYPEDAALPRLIRLSWYGPDRPQVMPGERWAWTVRLKRPRGFANPVRFDYERYLAGRSIDATGYVRAAPGATRLGREAGVDSLRARVAGAIRKHVGADAGAAVIRALVVGDRRGIGDRLWSVLRASGTAHLVAISGLHVGLVAGIAWLLVGYLARCCPPVVSRVPARTPAAVAGAAAAAGYAALAGFSLPTSRALIMLALAATAQVLRRRAPPMRVVLLTACLVTLAAPQSMLSGGFWLSFAAVGLVLGAAQRVSAGAGALRRTLRVQAAVTLGLAPLTVLLFGNLALLSFPVNLVAIPLFSVLVVPLALLGAAVGVAGFDGGFGLLRLLARCLDHILAWLAGLVAATPALSPQLMSGWTVAALAAAATALALRPLASPALALTLLAVAPAVGGARVPDGLRVSFLDVGQGNAVVVRTRRHAMVYDTGPAWRSGATAARFTLVPYLQQHGVGRVDRIVVSHADIDHSGGTATLAEALPHGPIWSGEPLPGFPGARRCHRGQRWRWDGVRFRVLWPPRGAALTGNPSSCVLLIEGAGVRVLLTGDLEARQEAALEPALPRGVDFLQVPHHGSRSSSSPAFVARVRPRVAVISAGYRNRYGLPVRAVVQRYRCAGARVLNTATVGAVTVRAPAPGVVSVDRWRVDHGHAYNEGIAATFDGFQANGRIQYDSSHAVESDCRRGN